MRCFDRTVPEERNRVITDQLSTLLLCSSAQAVENLAAEQVPGQRELVGDVMVDVAQLLSKRIASFDLSENFEVSRGEYLLVSVHRAANVDAPAQLEQVVELLSGLPMPTVLPLHPRTRARLEATGLLAALAQAQHVNLLPPLGYIEFAGLLRNARAVLTDSGGVQKEAYLAGVPCVTLRSETEWVETVESGWNELVGLDVERALAALERPLPDERPALYGDGHAGERVVAALERAFATYPPGQLEEVIAK
jgi:UDP-N-acetylglucosamine 2-epimerase (non-hydrolysing)/UDP-GlcNAc3NAcA epimerase